MRLFMAMILNRSGATAVEYGLIAALISVGLIGGLGAFGEQLQIVFEKIRDAVANAG